MSGWVSVAKKDNVYVVGADTNGKIMTSPSEQAAMAHICSLIDFDTVNQTQLGAGTIEKIFND